jgi:S1-C subfamily serine protease
MFCSSCGLRDPSSATGETGLTLQSLAVLIETSVGDERRATIRVLATEVQGSWGLGEAIPGLGQLDRIAPTWIELVDLAGRRGRLSLRLDSSGAAGDGPGTAMPASQPAANPWAARIHAIDGQHYEVDRDLIRELVTGVAKADGVRPVPILDHGEIKGLRLLGVSPSSIPAALGLRSGDTLTAIDGAPIKNLQQLIDLYAGLAQVSSVELSGTHGSAPLVRTLHLR